MWPPMANSKKHCEALNGHKKNVAQLWLNCHKAICTIAAIKPKRIVNKATGWEEKQEQEQEQVKTLQSWRKKRKAKKKCSANLPKNNSTVRQF